VTPDRLATPAPTGSASLGAAMGRAHMTPDHPAASRAAVASPSMRSSRGTNALRAAIAGLAVAGALAAAAGSASAAATIGGWGQITADMGSGAIAWADAQPATTKTFTYWRVDAAHARVTSRGISGETEPVAVRTSAGPFTGVDIRMAGPRRAFTLSAASTAFTGPVIWCCTTDDLEVVTSSDSDGSAPHPYGAGMDGTRVRWISGGPGGAFLGSGDPVENAERVTSAPIPGNPGPGLASVAQGIAAWADTGGTSIRIGVPSDTGVSGIRQVQQGGRVAQVRAVPGYVVAVVRAGGWRVTRTDAASGAVTVVWRGSSRPQIGAGGRAIAIGAGRAVLTSRGGAAKKVGDAKGPIAAIATDGSRVAVFERVSRRAKVGKVTKTVRNTAVRIVGRVR